MPSAPKRPCTYPGCGALVSESSRCEAHRRVDQRELDRRRGSSSQRGYTWRWKQYRVQWLRAHPLCGDRLHGASGEHSECARLHRVTPATDVDHIEPVDGAHDPGFWEPSNHQSLCHACHSMKTARENGGFGNAQRNTP